MQATKLNLNPAHSLVLKAKFTGNIIPHEWYKHFTNKNKIAVLSEILFKAKLKHNRLEDIKFKLSYKDVAKKFNFNLLQTKTYVKEIEESGFLERQVINNQVYIIPNIKAINEISGGDCLNTSGNLIPNEWYHNIIKSNGNVSSLSIMILGQILYWNRESKLKPSPYGKKTNQGWHTCYLELMEMFGVSKETIRRSLVELEEHKVIYRMSKVCKSAGTRNNTLVIYLNEENLLKISGSNQYNEPNDELNVQTRTQITTPYIIEKENTKKSIDLELNLNNKNSKKRNLESYLPLNDLDANFIAEKAGREFTANGINKLAKHLASKYLNNLFMNRTCVVNYLIKAVASELRSATEINKLDFKFITKEHMESYKVDKLLNEIEDSNDRSFNTQVRKQIIHRFEPEEAYDMVTNTYFSDINYVKEGEPYKIKFYNGVPKLVNFQTKIKAILQDLYEGRKLPKIVFQDTSRERKEEITQAKNENKDNIVEFKRAKSLTEYLPLSGGALNRIKTETGKDFDLKEHELTDWFFKLRANFVFQNEEVLTNELIKGMING